MGPIFIISLILNGLLITAGIYFYKKILAASFTIHKFRMENDFYQRELNSKEIESIELKTLCEQLKDAKYLAEKEKEVAFEKTKNAEKLIKDYEENRTQIINHSKAAIFEMAGEVSSRLIGEHRRETEESKTESTKKIKEITDQYHLQFNQIIESVACLSSSVAESGQAVNLVRNALLSPAGAGALAEITLENILKNSGLSAGRDYQIQHSIMGENNVLRPDAICYLPAGNILLIDAKASKFLLECNEDGGDTKLLQAMKLHLKQLASRDYQSAFVDSSNKKQQNIRHVSTIMFLPTESAVDRLQKIDPDFLQSAWNLGIYPSGPIGLVNILSHAKFTISENLQVENYRKIIAEVSSLLSSIAVIHEHGRKVGSSISSAVANFDKFSASFNSNFLSKARNIEKLGVISANKKALPAHLERYQLISAGASMIEVEPDEEENLLPEEII